MDRIVNNNSIETLESQSSNCSRKSHCIFLPQVRYTLTSEPNSVFEATALQLQAQGNLTFPCNFVSKFFFNMFLAKNKREQSNLRLNYLPSGKKGAKFQLQLQLPYFTLPYQSAVTRVVDVVSSCCCLTVRLGPSQARQAKPGPQLDYKGPLLLY